MVLDNVTSGDEFPRDGLFGYSPDEIEQLCLEHVVGALYSDGYSDSDFEIAAMRVIGSRMTEDLYRKDSDIDVLMIYSSRYIRDDDMFSIVNSPPCWIEGIEVDVFPECERSLETMLAANERRQNEKRGFS